MYSNGIKTVYVHHVNNVCLTPIPNLYDHSFPRYGQITFLTFRRPTNLWYISNYTVMMIIIFRAISGHTTDVDDIVRWHEECERVISFKRCSVNAMLWWIMEFHLMTFYLVLWNEWCRSIPTDNLTNSASCDQCSVWKHLRVTHYSVEGETHVIT